MRTPLGLLIGLSALVSDLPVQAFARHCAAALPADRGRRLIGGMRGVLEGRPELVPADIDLSGSEDGFDVVQTLARALGVDPPTVSTARVAAAADLVASAFAVDPAPGVTDLLTALTDAGVRVWVTAAHPDGVGEVVSGTELDRWIDPADVLGGPTAAATALTEVEDPSALLVLDTRWADLRPATASGIRTALVDRFGRHRGVPTWRGPDVAGLASGVLGWAGAGATR